MQLLDPQVANHRSTLARFTAACQTDPRVVAAFLGACDYVFAKAIEYFITIK